MNKINFALAALLIVTLIAACGIATGSFTIGYELNGPIESTNATLDREVIDLTTIQDYNDHKDQIESVDNVAVVGKAYNYGNTAVSGEVWLAYDSTYGNYGNNSADTVRAYGTRIFVSPVIEPGDSLVIDWDNGLDYIENFSEIQDAVMAGQFVLYGLGDSQFFYVYFDVDVIITFTAGL